jgi:hypothetical protein
VLDPAGAETPAAKPSPRSVRIKPGTGRPPDTPRELDQGKRLGSPGCDQSPAAAGFSIKSRAIESDGVPEQTDKGASRAVSEDHPLSVALPPGELQAFVSLLRYELRSRLMLMSLPSPVRPSSRKWLDTTRTFLA